MFQEVKTCYYKDSTTASQPRLANTVFTNDHMFVLLILELKCTLAASVLPPGESR